MFKKVILSLFLFLIAVATIVFFVASRSFNADAFRQQLVDRVQEITGRTMTVNGETSLVWQPLPTLTLKDVVLSNIDGAKNSEMLKIDEMEIQIEWTSLIEQPTKIKQVILRQPTLFVERLSDKKTNLKFAQLFQVEISGETQNLLGDYQRVAQIGTIEVINGSIQYDDMVSGLTGELNSVHGKINLKSLNGPITFDGRGIWNSVPLNLSFELGALKVSQPQDIQGKITEPTSHSTLDFFGQILPDDSEKYLKLDGNITSEKPNELLKLLKLELFPESMNVPCIGNFKVELMPKEWSWESVNLRIGDTDSATAFNGKWTHQLFQKKIDLTLNVTSFDYDSWAPYLHSSMINGLKEKISSITGTVDIEKFVINDSRVENIHFDGSYKNGVLRARQFSCLLPGGSSVQANGSIQMKPMLKVKGNIEAQVDNARDLLTFLRVPMLKVDNTNLLRKGSIGISVNMLDTETNITINSFSMDETSGVGSVIINNETGAKIDLALQQLNLDGYLATPNSTEAQQLSGDIHKLEQNLANLNIPSIPIQWQVSIDGAVWRRVPIKQIKSTGSISASALAGSFVVDDMASANIQLDYNIDQPGSEQWVLKQGKLSLITGQLDVFLRRSGWTSGLDFFDNAKQFSLDMEGSGIPSAWHLTGAFKKQSLDVQFDGQLEPVGLKDMHVILAHPDFRVFISAVDDNFSGFPGLTGMFKFDGYLSGTPKKLSATNMTMDIGNQQLMGSWFYEPATRTISADLKSTSLNLSKFLPDLPAIYVPTAGFSEQNFAIEKLSPWTVDLNLHTDQLYYKSIDLRNVELNGSLKDKMLALSSMKAQWGQANESEINLSGRMNWNEETPQLNLNILLHQFPLRPDTLMIDTIGLTKGILDLSFSGHFLGYSPKGMVKNASGQGNLSITDTTWVGADISSALSIVQKAKEERQKKDEFEPALIQALMNGKTPVQSIKADFGIKNGDIKITNGEMKLESAEVPSLQGIYHLPTNKVEVKASLSLLPSTPRILYTMDNIKRLNYYADVSQFSKALETEILNIQKTEADKKIVELQNMTVANLKAKKVEAQEAISQLKTRLNKMEEQLVNVPNNTAQEYWQKAQNIFLSIAPLANKDLDSVQGYAQIIIQANTAQSMLTQAEQTVFDQNLTYYQRKAAEYIQKIDRLLLEMSDFYYKKKELSILSGLIQGSQEQRNIIQRASVQLKLHLTPDQARKVYEIIEDAFHKVQKAHQYAYDLYTGKKEAPDTGMISVGG